jgi:hypothetical protein
MAAKSKHYGDIAIWIEEVIDSCNHPLQEIVATTMNETTFKAVHQPTLALYYYKDEAQQDKVVKVSAIKSMLATIATPDSLKRGVAMPNVGNHVMCSSIRSNDVAGVIHQTEKFLIEVMHLKRL